MNDMGITLIGCIILGLVYAVVLAFEEKWDNDFDEITERKCKKCISYSVCSRHGRDINCREYMDEAMLLRKGIRKDDDKNEQ